ncbi:MAG: radical SAM protein [Deltaproteobacteria bacterium]|nr:radical SAM protein [Deltaproteobacteria bacterium]
MPPALILINPWITDFAAYDLWSKPLGLLAIAGLLRSRGYAVHLIDCLDVHHPGMQADGRSVPPVRRAYGTGKFWRTEIPRPAPLGRFRRPYSRYGIAPELFAEALAAVPDPSAVLITSLMTYWYPGVQEAVSLVRRVHPRVPVILGGIYAQLCREHAVRYSGADLVAGGRDPEAISQTLEAVGAPSSPPAPNDFPPHPAFDLLRDPEYVCVATSTGCPYCCRYCASSFLQPVFRQRSPEAVLEEILHWRDTLDIRDVAFYDDALLVNAQGHARPLLKGLSSRASDLRFHAPNALHLREVTAETARLLHQAGFRTIRLGLETTDFAFRRRLDQKVREGEFERAVEHFRLAGYRRAEIGVYVMMGLPGQSLDSVKRTLEAVRRAGAVPHLAEYSPIPHTDLWPEAVAGSDLDLSEPLLQNNTLLPCWDEEKRARASALRALAREIRRTEACETGRR